MMKYYQLVVYASFVYLNVQTFIKSNKMVMIYKEIQIKK